MFGEGKRNEKEEEEGGREGDGLKLTKQVVDVSVMAFVTPVSKLIVTLALPIPTFPTSRNTYSGGSAERNQFVIPFPFPLSRGARDAYTRVVSERQGNSACEADVADA